VAVGSRTTGRPKRVIQLLAGVAVAVLAGILVWSIVTRGKGAAQGEPAPVLTLARLDAPGRLSLASLRGKVVAVNFWASWCVPCREEAPLLERTWNENRSKGLVVLGVDANDGSSDARSFMRKHGLTYPVVHDGKGSTLGHWGVPGLPTTFVVGRDGRIVAKVLGGLGDTEKAATFADKISEALTR